MRTLLSQPAAELLLAVDALGKATLTEAATTTGRSLSTVQRAAAGLLNDQVLERVGARGPLKLARRVPRQALRDIARWRLGKERTAQVLEAAGYVRIGGRSLPSTVRQSQVRRSLPVAVERIVSKFEPSRVILFGSQARGDADRHSDVDLLIVFTDEGDQRNRRIAIRRLLRDMPFPKDGLVASDERYQHPLPGTALKAAVPEGVTLYER